MDETNNPYYEKRLDKLEQNQEKTHEKVEKIHEDLVETKADLRVFTERVAEHVSSDKKIATEIEPLVKILPSLTSMVEDHDYKKTRNKKWIKRLKVIGMVLGVISTLASIAVRFQYLPW